MTTIPTITEQLPKSPAPNAKDPARAPSGPAKKAVKGNGPKGAKDDQSKSSKKKLIVLIAIVAILGLGGMEAKATFFPPHYSAAHPAPKTTIYPLPLSNPFTVSTSDGHLVETSVSLWLTAAADSAEITGDEGAIENIVITVLGNSTQPVLESPAGREQARDEILSEINQLLGTVHGGQQVADVLFTGSFVLQ